MWLGKLLLSLLLNHIVVGNTALVSRPSIISSTPRENLSSNSSLVDSSDRRYAYKWQLKIECSSLIGA